MSERSNYWARLLGAWEKSGLSQAEFCRRRGVKAVTFAWWKRKLGDPADPHPPRRPHRRTAPSPVVGSLRRRRTLASPARSVAGTRTANPPRHSRREKADMYLVERSRCGGDHKSGK